MKSVTLFHAYTNAMIDLVDIAERSYDRGFIDVELFDKRLRQLQIFGKKIVERLTELDERS